MLPHQLEDGTWVLQSAVFHDVAKFICLVSPGGTVVAAAVFVVTGKEAVVELVLFINESGSVGVVDVIYAGLTY
jgi:hypothetical protein